jgi:hypothetical protein
MKRLLALAMVALVWGGCATKEETARTNLERSWRIDKVFENGSDVTTTYTSTHQQYRISFFSDGSYNETYYPYSGAPLADISGTWLFTDGIRKLTLNDNAQSRVFQIDKLEKNALNLTNLSSNNGRVFNFVPD